jgi:hypothetical protein
MDAVILSGKKGSKEKKEIRKAIHVLREITKKSKKSFWKKYGDLEYVDESFVDECDKAKRDKTDVRNARKATLWMLKRIEKKLDDDEMKEVYWLLGFVVGILYSFNLIDFSSMRNFNTQEKKGLADSIFWIECEVSFEDLKKESS